MQDGNIQDAINKTLVSDRVVSDIGDLVAVEIGAARKKPNVFMPYVLKDEFTGRPILQMKHHMEWQVLMDHFNRLVILAFTESGKSQQVAIGRVLYELGRNPALRVVVVSNTHEQASKLIRQVGKYIVESQELKQVFPKLEKSEPWTSHSITVKRDVSSKDPSVQACGVHGNITGARIDLLILDDILDFENCRTPGLRQDLWDWYHAALSGRLTKDARVFCISNAWHPEDIVHKFAKHPSWHFVKYPIINEDGESAWPERWPMDRVLQVKEERGPLEFARQMMCEARDDAQARFKKEWIDRCLDRGNNKQMSYSIERAPSGCKVVTGVDLAVQKKKSSGKTVLFTIMVHPDGTREVLCIESGKWTGQEIVDKIVDTHRRFDSIVIVESNAAQDFIVQFVSRDNAIPIRPFVTGKNKISPEFGVESIAAEMAAAKWIIPNIDGKVHQEISEWITQMLYYDPAAHTGDSLIASWIAREGARMNTRKIESGRLDLMSR